MTGTCMACGQAASLQQHHITGRRDGQPYHDALTVPLCGRCHRRAHQLWAACGLDGDGGPELLLRRLAVWLADWRHPIDGPGLTALAEVLDEIAVVVQSTAIVR